jgi:hypothetical protein
MVLEVSVHSQLAPLLLGLWQGRSIMAEDQGGGNLLTFYFCSLEIESKRKGQGTRYPSKTLRDLLHPTGLHFLTAQLARNSSVG